jgi:hypothetical protein
MLLFLFLNFSLTLKYKCMEDIDLLIDAYLIPLNFKLSDNNFNGFEEYNLIKNNSYKIYIHKELKKTKFYVFNHDMSDMKTKIDNYYNIIAYLKEEFKYELRKLTINKILNDKP